MLHKLRSLPIATRVLISAVAGLLPTSFFVAPVILAAVQHYDHGNDYWLEGLNILEGVARGPGTFILAVASMSPLIAIALLVSLAFRRSIERHLAAWCMAAPFSVWIFVCVFTSITRGNFYHRSHGFLEIFQATLPDIGTLLYLVGPIPAAVIFYFISRRR